MDYIKYIRGKVGRDMIIVAGAGVFIYKDGKVLLQKRRDNQCWALHGGCINIGETVEEAAKRELYEETGLIAGKLELLGVFSGKDMIYTYPNGDQVCVVGITYICRDFKGDPLPDTDETLELKWFDANDMPQNISPPDRKAFEAFADWVKNAV